MSADEYFTRVNEKFVKDGVEKHNSKVLGTSNSREERRKRDDTDNTFRFDDEEFEYEWFDFNLNEVTFYECQLRGYGDLVSKSCFKMVENCFAMSDVICQRIKANVGFGLKTIFKFGKFFLNKILFFTPILKLLNPCTYINIYNESSKVVKTTLMAEFVHDTECVDTRGAEKQEYEKLYNDKLQTFRYYLLETKQDGTTERLSTWFVPENTTDRIITYEYPGFFQRHFFEHIPPSYETILVSQNLIRDLYNTKTVVTSDRDRSITTLNRMFNTHEGNTFLNERTLGNPSLQRMYNYTVMFVLDRMVGDATVDSLK
jgi:hypothetical protein